MSDHNNHDSATQLELSYKEAICLFLQDCKARNLTKETIRRYRNGLDKFQQHLNSLQLVLNKLTTPLLSHRIIPGMLDEGLALRTVNCNLCILKEFYKFLVEEGWSETNIAADLKPFKVQPSLTHTFTDGQLQRLLAQPDRSTFTGYRNFVMMLVLLETGIRLKELANLRMADLYLEEGSLRIQQGKGRKSRLVPIQRITTSELKQYIQERGTLNNNDRLWVTLDNHPFHEAGIRVMVTRYCKVANIQGVQCSCHTFRHTIVELFSSDIKQQHKNLVRSKI